MNDERKFYMRIKNTISEFLSFSAFNRNNWCHSYTGVKTTVFNINFFNDK